MKILSIAILSMATSAASAQTPPPLVDAYSPNKISSNTQYDCGGTKVIFEYSLSDVGLLVKKYQNDSKVMDKNSINNWNYFLKPIKKVDSVQFLCSKTVSTVAFIGQTTDIHKDTVQVYILDGVVRPMILVDQN